MAGQRKTVLTVGACGMEMTLQAPKLPVADESLTGSAAPTLFCGGRAGNSALALLGFGAQGMLCSAVGEDFFGQQLLSLYEKRGLDCRFVSQSKDACTAVTVRLAAAAEQRAEIVYPGAYANLSEKQISQAFAQQPDMLLANLDLPFDRVYYAVHTAQKMNIPVVLDVTASAADVSLSVLPQMEAVIADEATVERCTGIHPGGVDDCMKAALAFSRCVKARYHILHLKERGCYLYDGRLPHFVAGYRTVQKDTAAAMEAFCAALCAAMVNGADMNAACHFAAAAYALTASKEGTAEAFPTLSEISYLMTGKA